MCENGSDQLEAIDPRVQVELEKLNNATDEINRLELELDDSRAAFRQLLCESTAKVDALRVKLGLCIERAKPYYEARFCANEALKQTQNAAMKYERANSAHSAAKEMVYLAEQGLGGRTLDPAWQEMLNHATQRVNDAERDRGFAEKEHRLACIKHEAANAKVQCLQKELKRAITKSRPYYELKAQFYHMLEQQKAKVQNLEMQVTGVKMTYAEALRNLEQISDEIHKSRSQKGNSSTNQKLEESKTTIDPFLCAVDNLEEEYMSLPTKLSAKASPTRVHLEEVDGFRNVNLTNGLSPVSISSCSENDKSERDKITVPCSQSGEWTEINLEVSSPEEDFPYERLEANGGVEDKPKLTRQKTLPNPKIENEFSAIKSRMKLDTTISNWITRSSAKNEEKTLGNSRRQSLDNILGPTSEKMKEFFSQGIMMLNISNLTERRNSEPKLEVTEEKQSKGFIKKIPSPLERTLTYLNPEDDSSDSESLASVDMLTEDQISSLMFDKELGVVCEQVLGTPISELVPSPSATFPKASTSQVINN
ncbi:coiled-coil domain-containing protein 18 isoform X2 [Agrilus planipennis]|uniref:SH3 domain-binding protein 5-like n=1 Tax=Agrilus planipennis TaxID=224129 RepID=A0A1W4XDP0_AGRPL|nr:coiled-coil domain-containing protein 18 isoform X2 [Agrilus planipennis]